MIATLLTIGLALAGVAVLVAAVLAIVSRHRAGVGRIDPASMNEVLVAERSAHVSHGPRSAQQR